MKQSLHPERAARQVFRMTARRPALGLVLGSGFQAALADLQVEAEIGYDQLPGFPPVGVSGHAGKLLVANFPWDGNSYVGNEYWMGMLSASSLLKYAFSSILDINTKLVYKII